MYSIAIFERFREETFFKKETSIGYLQIVEQMSKQIHAYMVASQNGTLAKNMNNIYIYQQKVSIKKHWAKSLTDNRRKKINDKDEHKQCWHQLLTIPKIHISSQEIFSLPIIHLFKEEMKIFSLGIWPLFSCTTFHSPFCCRYGLVGHTPISYSLSFIIHSRTFHLAFLIASCSAVVSGNAWLYSLLNQAGVVLVIQGTPHQKKKSNCRWAIVFHFISHTQKSSGDHPVGALKYRFQDTFLS